MTIFLVRHGSAGMRRDGDPLDTERHLDEVGLEQAAAIARHLAGRHGEEPITRVLTSPAARCVETVAPTAAELGLTLEPADDLFEGTDVEVAWRLAAGLADQGVSAVLCSHGDVIPELIRRARMRGMDSTGSGCRKGSIWELRWDGSHDRFDLGTYVAAAG